MGDELGLIELRVVGGRGVGTALQAPGHRAADVHPGDVGVEVELRRVLHPRRVDHHLRRVVGAGDLSVVVRRVPVAGLIVTRTGR